MLNISHFIYFKYTFFFKKNPTHAKKVGHTSEFLFGIYWWTLKNPKNENFEKMKTFAGDIIILHMCTKNHDGDRIFCHFGPFFALLPPPSPYNPKNQNFEKWKKHLEMSSFQTF